MEHRTFLDALDAQKDAQDFLLATVLEGQQQGTALLLCDGQVAWTSAPETLLTQNLSARLPACLRWEIRAFLPSVLVPGHGWSSAEADM